MNRVFKKRLESEKEAAQPAMNSRTQLNHDNYTFKLIGYEGTGTGGQYVLQVSPKSRSKFVSRDADNLSLGINASHTVKTSAIDPPATDVAILHM